MTIMVRDLPRDERPREKLIAYGADALSNAELLAVLLHTGTREQSVLHLAESVLGKFKERGIASSKKVEAQDDGGFGWGTGLVTVDGKTGYMCDLST